MEEIIKYNAAIVAATIRKRFSADDYLWIATFAAVIASQAFMLYNG